MKHQNFLQEIASSLALSVHELVLLIAKAPHSYKTYKIDKRTGGKRIISQPARETKYVQHLLIESVFKNLPIHECATAYTRGSSIKKNADKHKANQYLSKFDFCDFFGSISESDLVRHFAKHLSDEVPENGFKLISRACCIHYKGSQESVLSVGAPSSPILSNSIMHEFDCLMYNWCKDKDVTYTRYADDLTFSTNVRGRAFEIEAVMSGFLESIEYPRLKLNNKKTIHASKKNQRRVTGLIISNEGKVSLGRERKRHISAMIHKYLVGALPAEEVPHLQGLLGFAEDVEPIFSSRMRAKYGVKVISEIFQFRKVMDENNS